MTSFNGACSEVNIDTVQVIPIDYFATIIPTLVFIIIVAMVFNTSSIIVCNAYSFNMPTICSG